LGKPAASSNTHLQSHASPHLLRPSPTNPWFPISSDSLPNQQPSPSPSPQQPATNSQPPSTPQRSPTALPHLPFLVSFTTNQPAHLDQISASNSNGQRNSPNPAPLPPPNLKSCHREKKERTTNWEEERRQKLTDLKRKKNTTVWTEMD
jgi:hypothetical protein